MRTYLSGLSGGPLAADGLVEDHNSVAFFHAPGGVVMVLESDVGETGRTSSDPDLAERAVGHELVFQIPLGRVGIEISDVNPTFVTPSRRGGRHTALCSTCLQKDTPFDRNQFWKNRV